MLTGTLTEDMVGINLSKSTKPQDQHNKQIMRQRSAVFRHIFLRLHSKQPLARGGTGAMPPKTFGECFFLQLLIYGVTFF